MVASVVSKSAIVHHLYPINVLFSSSVSSVGRGFSSGCRAVKNISCWLYLLLSKTKWEVLWKGVGDTFSRVNPVSSRTSRSRASISVSVSETPPPGVNHQELLQRSLFIDASLPWISSTLLVGLKIMARTALRTGCCLIPIFSVCDILSSVCFPFQFKTSIL